MNYTIKLILYILSKAFLYASFIGFIYSIVMIFVESEEATYWIVRSALFLILSGIALLLYIVRKSKIPLPGRDYH